jgi:hypothetical protein
MRTIRPKRLIVSALRWVARCSVLLCVRWAGQRMHAWRLERLAKEGRERGDPIPDVAQSIARSVAMAARG